MANFVVYDPDTGAILRAGEAPDSMIAIQAQEGEAVVAVPFGVIGWPDIDLTPLRQHLKANVDIEAEAFRLHFITAGAGQAVTYIRKETEARAWLADNSTATPMLTAEATALGVSLSQLVTEVIAAADQWLAVGSAIEARRRAAKASMDAASNIAELVTAGRVEWEQLLS